MPRVTPTGLAEAAYGARGGKMAIGRDGIPVPGDRVAFRLTVDGPLLTRIGSAAISLYARKHVCDDDVAAARRALLADMIERYPVDEMRVLEKWGEAWSRDAVYITLPAKPNLRFELPEPVLVPRSRSCTYAPDGERNNLPLPVSTAHFFHSVNHVEEARKAVKNRLHGWVAAFKGNAKRAPRWGEIADAWPVIADWLADQRRAS
ncbi:hypothetical protein [Sphingomonas abietis]|uniref:Uncharacterized protein n=1 Tax=Sphingomonas abietis TaxID=3012344 RepID=A0ABY7NSP3_9SPHN|nr:hypothetical protein [Sphingomonas abietis]WBO23975.1 hypothetical protein PBT88_07650 [Sphingomonas abietis]